jgi:hypothetical protein
VVAPPVKRSVFWSLAALASIAYLVAMVIGGALPELRSRVKFEAQGVMTLPPERIDRVEIERGATRVALARTSGGGWSRQGGEVLSVPVAAKVSLAVQYMRTAGPVRVMTAEEIRGIAPAEFGLAPPELSVALFAGPEQVLRARFGARNAEDLLQYMTLDGRDGMYLMSRFVGQQWDASIEAVQPR